MSSISEQRRLRIIKLSTKANCMYIPKHAFDFVIPIMNNGRVNLWVLCFLLCCMIMCWCVCLSFNNSCSFSTCAGLWKLLLRRVRETDNDVIAQPIKDHNNDEIMRNSDECICRWEEHIILWVFNYSGRCLAKSRFRKLLGDYLLWRLPLKIYIVIFYSDL